MGRAGRMHGSHFLFPAFNSLGYCVGRMMPERDPVKLTRLLRRKGLHFLAGELLKLRGISKSTSEASSLFHTIQSRSKPASFQSIGKVPIASWLDRRESQKAPPNSFICLNNANRDCPLHKPTGRLVTRKFACSPMMPTPELDEDFEEEACKQVTSGKDIPKVSIRIEPLRAGFLDKEVLRKRRTQPFSDKCWMQGLGVGLYRDKLRNHRSLSTLGSYSLEEQPVGTSTTDPLRRQTIEAETCGTGVSVEDRKESPNQKPHQGGLSSVVAADDDTLDDVGETDSDDENGEPDDRDRTRTGMPPTMVIAENVEVLEASLKELEASTDAGDLRVGATCLRLAQLCDSADEDPEKILMYGERALKILGSTEVSPETAMCHQVIGSAYFKMDKSEKAVGHLERAAMIIEKLEATVKGQEIGTIEYAIQALLGHAKMSLGRHAEALVNYHESLAINERLLEPGNPDLARSYQQVAEACMEADDPEEARRLCMKALPIYTNYYGPNSLQVAVIRRLMALIYTQHEDYESFLTEYNIIRPILESLGKSKEVVSLDLVSGEALISLDRYKEAITTLKGIVQQAKANSRFHGHALVLLGKAFAGLKEGKEAAKYCKKALNALKDKKLSLEAGSSLVELAAVYQQLNEQEQSMGVLQRALKVFEQHPDQQEAAADVEGQIGLLSMFMGKVDEGLPYLKKSAAKIRDIYGPESEELLAAYNHIAIASLELGKLDDALDKFEEARAIATKRHGPDTPDTIAIFRNLVNTYSDLGRLDKAIECQKHVVDSLRAEAGGSLEEAQKRLQDLLKKVNSSGSSARQSKYSV